MKIDLYLYVVFFHDNIYTIRGGSNGFVKYIFLIKRVSLLHNRDDRSIELLDGNFHPRGIFSNILVRVRFLFRPVSRDKSSHTRGEKNEQNGVAAEIFEI